MEAKIVEERSKIYCRTQVREYACQIVTVHGLSRTRTCNELVQLVVSDSIVRMIFDIKLFVEKVLNLLFLPGLSLTEAFDKFFFA